MADTASPFRRRLQVSTHLQASLQQFTKPSPYSVTSNPAPYSPALVPLPSPLRPHCLARDRIKRWLPSTPRSTLDNMGIPLNLSTADMDLIKDVLAQAYAESMAGTYGTGLLAFHVYCDIKKITEEQRAPTGQLLLSGFISALAGAYAGRTLSNYVYGVRAWHLIHGVAWLPNDAEMVSLLRAAAKLTPAQSKRKPRTPFTVACIESIHTLLDLSLPFDAAVFACLTTTFWSCARVGETTIPRINAFDPNIHVSASAPTIVHDREGFAQTEFLIPRTKCGVRGESISWAKQTGLSDPEAALQNHFSINSPPPDGPLFAYTHTDKTSGKKSSRPLTKRTFVGRVQALALTAGFGKLHGHGIRVGSTLEYLLRGIPFDVVLVKGRWKSNAFLSYLRKHAQVLAPYMQATPQLADRLTAITVMPPVSHT